MSRCPCGTGLPYAECCGPFHTGTASPPTAEALMRSRFSAFARQDESYLLQSWHSATRPKHVNFSDGLAWLRLDVLKSTGGALFDAEGTVLFEAHYADGKKPGVLREHSRFTREDGQWRYVAAI